MSRPDLGAGQSGLVLPSHAEAVGCGWDRAALAGMAETLRERTDLKVEISCSTVQLIWANDNPGLIYRRAPSA